jgi:hypothetical protein
MIQEIDLSQEKKTLQHEGSFLRKAATSKKG